MHDLVLCIDHGTSLKETARYLRRSEYDVLAKAEELGLSFVGRARVDFLRRLNRLAAPLKIIMALGGTLALSREAKAQTIADIVGIWTCPNFTLTIRAEGSTYLIHATPRRGLREYNVFGSFIDGQLQHTNSQLGPIVYVSSTKQLIFDGERCER